jgi:protein-disulfide isomerase
LRRYLDAVGTAAIVVAALAVTGSVVHREFFGSARAGQSGVVQGRMLRDRPSEPVYVDDWRDLLDLGTQIGAESAAVDLLVFTDLECPYCQRFHAAYKNARVQFGDNLRLTYIHYPLAVHRHAEAAARAAECAGAQDRFSAFVDAVFQQQASMGIKSWTAYAAGVGVPDTVTFNRCAGSTFFSERILSGKRKGEALGITGTPTVIINGWRLPRPPHDSLTAVIEAILDERAPYNNPD